MPGHDVIPARREFKYLVDRARIPAIRASIAPFCVLDPHADDDQTYGLRSLYLDTPDLRLFHANEREAPVRFKARIRCYPDAVQSPVFAEIKHRDGDVIRKTREALPAGDWEAGLRERGALGGFAHRMHRHGLAPVVLVDYRREAWISTVDPYARVTWDSQIRCQEARQWSLEADPRRWRAMDHGLLTFTPRSPLVLELKWGRFAPPWMVRLAQALGLVRESFSKYCYSMHSLAEDHTRDSREAQSVWI